jgi:phospholipid/cholesterol/gamma-HCH transport system substrate-binding protein
MERRANYALVGIVTLGLFVGLAAFVIWLAGFQFNKQYDVYDVVFIGPVRGISEGGEVHFNGIKVGEVTKLQLDPSDPNRVIARVRLTAGVPVRVDSYAVLEPQGITGVNYIQITGGSAGKPLLKEVTPHGQIPVIHSQRSALSDLLAGGGTVLQRAVDALDRVNKLLSDKNIATATAMLNDLKSVTEEMRERKAIIADAQRALQDMDKALVSVDELARSSNQLVNGDAKRTLSNLADAAEELRATGKSARGLISRLEGPTTDFAANGLPQLTATMQSLQQTSEELNSLLKEVQRSPTAAIAKPRAKEVEVKP